ncbi:hypothetical protein N803_00570 [Knoellia subterranea KCTC 19937]|uniref:PKD domain-containing protein n=1 Tax=Knoellia subterranea KCTC 19937 TaxID=1385521 RepID=A0A0A0JQR6_9MICO|nr:hypothetical protein N803_00570 [Knoellia subterranea KCTC 19937]
MPPGGGAGVPTGGGARVTLTLQELRKARADAAKAVGKPGPRWEYKTRINCAVGDPDANCDTAASACTNGQLQAVVLRRLVNPDGTPVPDDRGIWSEWGVTCFPDLLPGNTLPSLAQIRQAFRQVNFTKGDLSIQPVGNVTLVNLPTYFEATWPEAGVGPDEIDASTILGYRLEIQPIARSVTYVYGDGNTSGPTTSVGGSYPDGDIRWTYKQPGVMATRLDTTYGGRFRLEGGAWITIPGTVEVKGSPVNLTVREAKARLYNNG